VIFAHVMGVPLEESAAALLPLGAVTLAGLRVYARRASAALRRRRAQP
jgi:hypothetical protein